MTSHSNIPVSPINVKLSEVLAVDESVIHDNRMSLLKQPMIETPERYRRFDPHALMNMELIETPPMSLCRSQRSSLFLQMSKREKIICHKDFPRLVTLKNQIQIAHAAARKCLEELRPKDNLTVEEKIDISKASARRAVCHFVPPNDCEVAMVELTDRLGEHDFKILPGQCPITDLWIREHFLRLRHILVASITPKDEKISGREIFQSCNRPGTVEVEDKTNSMKSGCLPQMKKEPPIKNGKPAATRLKKRRAEAADHTQSPRRKSHRIRAPRVRFSKDVFKRKK